MKRSSLFVTALLLTASAALDADPAATGLTISGAEQPVQPGDVVRLTVVAPARVESVVATVFGESIRFFPRDGTTWQGLIGVDLAIKPGNYRVAMSATHPSQPATVASTELRVLAKQFPTRRLRVEGRFVDPPATELERIQREAKQLAASLTPVTERHWDGPFIMPVDGSPSSNFGSRSVYNGQPRSPHAGVDFRGEVGTPIAAPNAGRVVVAQELFFTGNTVVVDHGLGLYSLFAHLSRIDVAAGQPIAKGAVLGLLGGTGRVTAPHLHWAVRLNGARVDPMSLVAVLQNAP